MSDTIIISQKARVKTWLEKQFSSMSWLSTCPTEVKFSGAKVWLQLLIVRQNILGCDTQGADYLRKVKQLYQAFGANMRAGMHVPLQSFRTIAMGL